VDLAELAAMAGPGGLGGDRFAQGNTADVMRPGPVLAALTEQAAAELVRLSDDQLLGAVAAARRLAARAEYLELSAVAEFTRRRQEQFEASTARKEPRGCRAGEFADAELAQELVASIHAARDRMDLAAGLASRLPGTRAGLAAGVIDGHRASTIWYYTRFLADEHAAAADKILAAAAPGLRPDQLARRAAALEMRLDPDAARRRKDDARRDDQRVEARREQSGNAAVAGRELSVEDAMASTAHIDAIAAQLRGGGMEGSLRELRVLVYLDLTQGRDPLDRLTRPDQPDRPGRHPALLVRRPRPGRHLGADRPRRHPRRRPGRLPAPPHPVVRHGHRPRRHRRRARLRPRPAPLDPRTSRQPPAPARRRRRPR
jgi:hypothetical protein